MLTKGCRIEELAIMFSVVTDVAVVVVGIGVGVVGGGVVGTG